MKKTLFTILAAAAVSVSAAAQGVAFVEGKPLADVLAQAGTEGKLVFVDCYTEWCGPCKMMATREFVKQEAGDYFNAKFVNTKIDMEKGEGPEIGKKYDVNAYPTFLILDASGELHGRLVGSAGIGEFIKNVEAALTEEKGLPWYQKKFREGERGGQFVNEYVDLLNKNYMRTELKSVIATVLDGKTGAQIAADSVLFKMFTTGEMGPDDNLFLAVYRERPVIVSQQGEHAAAQLDGKWSQNALRFLKFDGKSYQGFDAEGFDAYKQKMAANGVPDVDRIVSGTLRTNALYAKDYASLYEYLEADLKPGSEPSNDHQMLSMLGVLVKDYKQNKKAMKTIAKFADRRAADLQKKDTTNEREFEVKGKKYTMTSYLMEQYQEVAAKAKEK